MKEYLCPITRTYFNYPENAIFKIYVRRTNCPKKLLKVTDCPKEACQAYLGVKVYSGDKAYIFANGEKIVHRNGKDIKPYSLRGFKSPPNYRRKVFATPNMPQTVQDSLISLDGVSLDGESNVSMSKAIILMASKLASMPKSEQIEFLRACVPDYEKHVVLSGGDNVDFVEDVIKEFGDYGRIESAKPDEDDLL